MQILLSLKVYIMGMETMNMPIKSGGGQSIGLVS